MAPRLIHFVKLAKARQAPNLPRKIILRPTNLSVPADRRLAVLGRNTDEKTTFLRLLAGTELPTEGSVVSRLRLSPIIRRGPLFHPRLTEGENILFYARALNLDVEHLMFALESFYGSKAHSVPGEGGDKQKAKEIGILTLMTFDCYLIDEIGHLSEYLRKRHLDALTHQRAGLIFTTNSPQLARQHGDCALVIRDGTIFPFVNVEEAIAFNER